MNKRRFIAGAVCPSCGAADKIVTFERQNDKFRACVSCGFEEIMRFDTPKAEVPTRVNRSLADRTDEVRPIRFLD